MNRSDPGTQIERARLKFTGEGIGQTVVTAANFVIHRIRVGAVGILGRRAVGRGQANGLAEIRTVHQVALLEFLGREAERAEHGPPVELIQIANLRRIVFGKPCFESFKVLADFRGKTPGAWPENP